MRNFFHVIPLCSRQIQPFFCKKPKNHPEVHLPALNSKFSQTEIYIAVLSYEAEVKADNGDNVGIQNIFQKNFLPAKFPYFQFFHPNGYLVHW